MSRFPREAARFGSGHAPLSAPNRAVARIAFVPNSRPRSSRSPVFIERGLLRRTERREQGTGRRGQGFAESLRPLLAGGIRPCGERRLTEGNGGTKARPRRRAEARNGAVQPPVLGAAEGRFRSPANFARRMGTCPIARRGGGKDRRPAQGRCKGPTQDESAVEIKRAITQSEKRWYWSLRGNRRCMALVRRVSLSSECADCWLVGRKVPKMSRTRARDE